MEGPKAAPSVHPRGTPRVHLEKGPYRQRPLLDSCNNVLAPKYAAYLIPNLNFPAFGHVEAQSRNQLWSVLDRDLLALVMLTDSLVVRRWRFILAAGAEDRLISEVKKPEK